jgi:hypothetical protein
MKSILLIVLLGFCASVNAKSSLDYSCDEIYSTLEASIRALDAFGETLRKRPDAVQVVNDPTRIIAYDRGMASVTASMALYNMKCGYGKPVYTLVIMLIILICFLILIVGFTAWQLLKRY